ncbi:hypothetical protein K435DRAFT_852361 [Dendrothele bispora CBS 962.96]|uniref:Uncharacterized protein n=1 Tax=Dendrothele bispora (strain CBS 962.96) TaxID=1314807 RepID=A0A4S8MJG1_DENBC|nr:hypothetical protein K435DRAFT_852361 [Dendrothele bispora CBS 962.96]
MITDLPETASPHASGYYPSPPGCRPLRRLMQHRNHHNGVHTFPPHLPGPSFPPFPSTAGQGAADFPSPPTREELPLHTTFSNLHLDEHSMHSHHAHGLGGRRLPMPPPHPHGNTSSIAPFVLHTFGHSRELPMPRPGPPRSNLPTSAGLDPFVAHGHPTGPTPFHSHVPGPPPPARSDRGRLRLFRAHARFATTAVPPTIAAATATATARADTPDTTTAETETTSTSTAPPPQATRDNTIPNPTLSHTRHHHRLHRLRGLHHLDGLHTHHGHGVIHCHHRGHSRLLPHARITARGGTHTPLLVNMRRVPPFSLREDIATPTDMANTSDVTTTDAQATVTSTAPPPQATRDGTIPNPTVTLPHTRHHHRHHRLCDPHHLDGLHTHHGRGGIHRHHRGHGRLWPHTPITARGGTHRVPLLVNMHRALDSSHCRRHGGCVRGLGFGRGRSFKYPYTGYPNPHHPFGRSGSDDMEGATSDRAREGEEEKRQEENVRAGTEGEHNQKDDQGQEDNDTQSATLDLGCLSPTLSSELSSESSLFISDHEALGAAEDGNERTTGTRTTRARNNDNDPTAEEEDYILLPPRSPSPSELDETSSVDSESNESNPDTTFILRGLPTSHAHSHHPHSHHNHDGPHHRPSRLWHHSSQTQAREPGLAGSSPGLGHGRGFSRGGHSLSRLHPCPPSHHYFHDHPLPPPLYHNGPDFDNNTHPDFDQTLGLGNPPLRPLPLPSFLPNSIADNQRS